MTTATHTGPGPGAYVGRCAWSGVAEVTRPDGSDLALPSREPWEWFGWGRRHRGAQTLALALLLDGADREPADVALRRAVDAVSCWPRCHLWGWTATEVARWLSSLDPAAGPSSAPGAFVPSEVSRLAGFCA